MTADSLLHAGAAAPPAFTILIPIYNDWKAVSLLLVDLDAALAQAGLETRVIIVDDGSTVPPIDLERLPSFGAIDQVDVLRLRCNLGHQRAIAVALALLSEEMQPDAVVVMDGDGEDAPADVPRLIARYLETRGSAVVFAERTKRSENLTFRISYALYRRAHRWLTGITPRVGNFSVVPLAQLRRLVVVPELWNHYAAAVFKARLPREHVPTVRARRLTGDSQMHFGSLIGHGLSGLSVHAEVIGVRLLIFTSALLLAMTMLLALIVGVRLFTSLAIPGWATNAAGLVVVLMFQTAGFAAAFAFLILHSRSQPHFIPVRDYQYFVSGLRTVWARAGRPILSPASVDR